MTSEHTDQTEDDNQESLEHGQVKTNKQFLFMIINFVLLIVVAIVAAYNIKSIKEIKEDNSVSQLITGINRNVEQVTGDLRSINSRIQRYETDMMSLSAAVEQSNESLEILYSNQVQDRRLPVTEVEQLINIANFKLKLEGNIKSAIVALEEANNNLADMGDPGLFSLRRQITADINTLKSTPQTDVAGMSMSLSDLAARVNSFPLKSSAVSGETENFAQTDPADPAWKRLLLGVWREFKSMFIITRTGESISTSLLPNEKFFLYQNLRLQLESARLAVLRNDTALLQDSLGLAETWLEEYFDLNDAAVNNAIEIIGNIRTLDLDQPAPEINASIEALNDYLQDSQESTATDNVIERP